MNVSVIIGLYPSKFVLFGEKMLISLGRLYEKTHGLQVRYLSF